TAVPNNQTGIFITNSNGGTVTSTTIGGQAAGAGNVISGNAQNGLSLFTSVTGTVVQGNRIGTNAAGTAAVANAGSGILVSGPSNTIGGAVSAARNVISGNAGTGVVLSGATATGNQVIGNLIGTDKDGLNAVPNVLLQSGINITNGASNNVIGAPGAGNVVSGNARHAITVCCGNTTSGNTIQSNFIGTDITGTLALGNGGIGIDVVSAANTTIGGAGAARNVISAN